VTRFLSVPLLLVCCAGPLAMQPPHKAEPPPAPPPAPAPAPAPPAGLTVDGKYTLTVTEMPFRVLAPTGADLYFWRVPAGWTVADNGDSLTVTAAPAGAATVGLQTVTIDWTNHKTLRGNYSLSVAVGGTPPPQPPGPGPQPPGPGPTPNPTTEPTVLIVYESSGTPPTVRLTAAQDNMLRGKELHDWFARKAPKRWRIWDQNVQGAENDAPPFAALLKRPRQSLPWLVIADPAGKPVFEGPLPADAAALLATLQQYGGQ
jgi:hypothetical protein